MAKGNVDVFANVLFLNRQPTFELHLKKPVAVDMASDEVCSLPVVTKPQAVVPLVG